MNDSEKNQEVQEVAPRHNVGRNGGRLNPGGTKGNKGGRDNSSKARRIRLEAISQKFLRSADSMAVAANPEHPAYVKLGTWATEMLEGRPKQAVEGGDKPLEVIIKVVEE